MRLTHGKATEAVIDRATNYPILLPEMPRYCCPVEIFYSDLLKFPVKIFHSGHMILLCRSQLYTPVLKDVSFSDGKLS